MNTGVIVGENEEAWMQLDLRIYMYFKIRNEKFLEKQQEKQVWARGIKFCIINWKTYEGNKLKRKITFECLFVQFHFNSIS